jgi:murein DD-endopeptidase MepM/ murein hydrolase activator NlpD
MPNGFYTFIFVPHAKARFRKIQVSVRLTRWLVGLGAVLGVVVAGVLAHYAILTSELVSLRNVAAENEALKARTLEYERVAERLQSQVLTLQRTVNKLGVMAGVETTLPDEQLGGQGGISVEEVTAPALETLPWMERTVADLVERSASLEQVYDERQVILASTPSIWPVRGYLSSRFGNRIDPFTGRKDFHPGIDISTPEGTKVVAPADGVVVAAGRRGAYGNAIIINHGHGTTTRYGHLSGFNVHPGQRVRRGDVIGSVGNTGRSNAPHLHYEVWVNDQLQNPIHYILDEYRSFG